MFSIDFCTDVLFSIFSVKLVAVKNRAIVNPLATDIVEVSKYFSDGKMWNSGLMTNGYYYMIHNKKMHSTLK